MVIRTYEDLPSDGYWHVAVYVKDSLGWTEKYNMSKEEIITAIVDPYRSWEEISVHGHRINRTDINQIKISHTNIPANSFAYMNDNLGIPMYRNLFDGAPNSKDYNTLLTRGGLDGPFVSPIEYEERIAKAKTQAKVNVIQNQTQHQAQNQVTNIVLDNYEKLSHFAELYAELIKQLKHKEVSSDLLSDAKEAQDCLDSITKNSEQKDVAKALRRVSRVVGEIKDIVSNGSVIASILASLMKAFNL